MENGTPRRVLHVVTELNIGGIQSFLLNLYQATDKERVQFDFLLSTSNRGSLEQHFEKMGSRIYRVTPRRESLIANRRDLQRFFSEHVEYDCVHLHMSNYSYVEPLAAAKKAGIPVRIIHSHSTSLPKGVAHKILHNTRKGGAIQSATHLFSCSDLAADWMFGGSKRREDVVIINNGIFVDRYVYDDASRREVREILGAGEDDVLVGLLGTIRPPKNHAFALDIARSLSESSSRYKMIFIGDGPERGSVEAYARELGVNDRVVFLGARSDVPELLNGIDIAIMPSHFEGFPVALLEEQAAGLTCIVSDSVTEQAKLNDNVHYLSLSDGSDAWAQRIASETEKGLNRCMNQIRLIDGGFSIEETARQLMEFYERCSK